MLEEFGPVRGSDALMGSVGALCCKILPFPVFVLNCTLPHKTGHPSVRVQAFKLCQQVLQQNLSLGKTGGCEIIPLSWRSEHGLSLTLVQAPSPELVSLCCRKVWLERIILLTVWASEDCGNIPAAHKVLV